MSLKVWLPLNGDFTNIGISNTEVELADGNTFEGMYGKVSKNALKITALQPVLPIDSCMSGAKEISYAFWVKTNSVWTTNWLNGIGWVSTDGTTTANCRQEFYTNCTKIGTWYKGGSVSNKSFTPGVWTHVAGTYNYNTGEVRFYLNGILQGTATNLDTTHYCRGDFNIGDNGVDILENDVRIYDHCLSAAEVHEISQGLIAHYKLDNTTSINDSSGYGHNGTITGTITTITDTPRYSSAYSFDGTAYGTIKDTIFDMEALYPELTWAGWIRKNYTTTEERYIYNGVIGVSIDSNKIELDWRHVKEDGSNVGTVYWKSKAVIPDETWIHIAAVFNMGVVKIYINGEYSVLSNSSAETGPYIKGYLKQFIGCDTTDSKQWIGDISDMRLYATALSEEDIRALYNIRMKVDNSGKIHTFEFNENQTNVFCSEKISYFAKSNETTGIGEIVRKNNETAICIMPRPFYHNMENDDSALLQGCFMENTSYVFDMWIDNSEQTSGGKWSDGGFFIYYTDETQDDTFVVSGQEGWQHKKLITPPNKTISKIVARYASNLRVLYRTDSYICPASLNKIKTTGVFTTANIIENYEIASIYKGGSVYSLEFIEA